MFNEFPTFFTMSKTGIRVETPNAYSIGYQHFVSFMQEKGWTFTEQLFKDYEMSQTFSVSNNKTPNYCHQEWDRDLAEYQCQNIRNLLIDLYTEKGLIDSSNNAVPLCDTCIHSSECYKGFENRKPSLTHPEWSYLSVPWIGANYNKNKIAVLGINPNEDGGLDQLYKLIDCAKGELSEGITKVNFGYVYENGKKYKGTFLWHRMAAYTKVVRSALSCEKGDIYTEQSLMEMKNFDPKSISDEFDNMTYLNHIKCSPLGELSKPTNMMWENCGKHILLEELKIIRPGWLIVFGTGDNLWAFQKHLLEGNHTSCEASGKLKYFKTTALGFKMNVIAIPHPASPAGGASTAYYQQLFDTTQSMKTSY